MLCIWGFSAVVVVLYFKLPEFRRYFDWLQDWHEKCAVLAILMDRIVFCGILPAIFMYMVKGLWQRRILLVCTVQVSWCCLWGLICDGLFHLQARLFGAGTDIVTLLLKTLVDQFVVVPLLIAPTSAVFCFWLARDLSLSRTRREWPRRFFADLVAPILLANWFVAIPVAFMMFAFPTDLQIHVNCLNSAFATLLFLQVGRRTT